MRVDNYISGLMRYLEHADIEAALLRSQIAVEAMLGHAIELRFTAPEHFGRLGLTAYRKIQLAVGLGIIERDDQRAFLQLNELRNRIAHRWSYELSEGNQKDLIDTIPISMLERFANYKETLDEPFPEPLRLGIAACFMMARHAYEAELAKQHGFRTHQSAEFHNWLGTPEGQRVYTQVRSPNHQ
jgi:hypothetical protein